MPRVICIRTWGAPLSASAIAAVEAVSRSYSNLELDLRTGKRGSRLVHAETLLRQLTKAEAAMVVNIMPLQYCWFSRRWPTEKHVVIHALNLSKSVAGSAYRT